MKIQIKVAGHAKEYISGGKSTVEVDIDVPFTPNELIEKLGINKGLVSAITVDNTIKRWDELITEEDVEKGITIISPVGGG
jgi:sulfur carrier protein ThiS